MLILYLGFWLAFLLGSLVLGMLFVVAAVRLLFGWRPRPTRDRAVPVLVGLVGASVFGFAYGASMWLGFPPDDASRGITAIPPLVFGVLAVAAAAGVGVTGWCARRTGVRGFPERRHPT